MNKDFIKLSKLISLILRHHPDKYNVVLDKEGWCDVECLLNNIKMKHNEYAFITYADILAAVNSCDKKRHEINGRQIRALYGHTIDILVKKVNSLPPIYLYHGTTNSNLKKIKSEGLKKMDRQYVHLSPNFEQAFKVASRKTNNPIVLKINALRASNEGVHFYKANDIWLCDFIANDFIEL